MDIKDLTPEQIEKMKGMSQEDLHEYIAEEGLPLSDEDLEQVAGGWMDDPCPKGGKHEWEQTDDYDHGSMIIFIETCKKCKAQRKSNCPK